MKAWWWTTRTLGCWEIQRLVTALQPHQKAIPAGAPVLNNTKQEPALLSLWIKKFTLWEESTCSTAFCFLNCSALACYKPCLALEVQRRMKQGSDWHGHWGDPSLPRVTYSQWPMDPCPQRAFFFKLKCNYQKLNFTLFYIQWRNGP